MNWAPRTSASFVGPEFCAEAWLAATAGDTVLGSGDRPSADKEGHEFVPPARDLDSDRGVDLVNGLSFSDGFTGPGGPAEPGCEPYDSTADTDMDLPVIPALFTGSK